MRTPTQGAPGTHPIENSERNIHGLTSRLAQLLLTLAVALAAWPSLADTACPDQNPDRNLYWGDLHVHTAFSFDASTWNVRALPADAYRFARGKPLQLPPLDDRGRGTRRAQLERPLDFAAVTDHAELMGELALCTDPESEVYQSDECRFTRGEGGLAGFAAWSASSALGRNIVAPIVGWVKGPRAKEVFSDPRMAAVLPILNWQEVKTGEKPRSAEVCGADGSRCRQATATVWARTQAAANEANDACEFTAFNAYEYSGAPGGSNLHRNVVFRGDEVLPLPISFVEASPEELWRRLATECLDAGTGCDALAIPHNPNRSNGQLLDPQYGNATSVSERVELAALRQRIEPLVEISQHKGDSECRNGMSGVLGAVDELCDYEKFRLIGKTQMEIESATGLGGDPMTSLGASAADCGEETGSGGFSGCGHRRDYVRYALVEGLAEEARLGVNPLKLGIIAGSDAHNANPGDVEEYSFEGNFGFADADPAIRLTSNRPPVGLQSNPGGVVAVWANENTRESLFDGLRRREAYGTSGPRIAVRFFGGWDYEDELCASDNFVATADAGGVPMGSDLTSAPDGREAPRFAVWTARDPGTSDHPGTDLERVQIIKGWVGESGDVHQAVFDVASTGDTSGDVDLDSCTPPKGADQLCGVWSDPEFDPAASAVYYARVVERPSCRYTRIECNRLAENERPDTCDDTTIPNTIRERAWTSPIWYTP